MICLWFWLKRFLCFIFELIIIIRIIRFILSSTISSGNSVFICFILKLAVNNLGIKNFILFGYLFAFANKYRLIFYKVVKELISFLVFLILYCIVSTKFRMLYRFTPQRKVSRTRISLIPAGREKVFILFK